MSRPENTGVDRAGSVFRVFFGGHAIISWYVGLTEPQSLMRVVMSTTDGAVLVWALMVVGVAAVLDAVINDFLPDRFQWCVAVRQRHFILMGLAFCYAAQLYVAFFNFRSAGLLAYYLWNASAIMAVAFVDAHRRNKDATCATTCK